ncbi:MAG: SDR family NAD(P)-dependent oxidoreductase [Ignavibacteria bacterium]|nr:SDR family NAD(P)-dependent oxidoreductase [Ignavibacteria bacterium]
MKNVLITGANRGIGFEIARQLGLKGFDIILTARDTEKGKQAVSKLIEMNINAEFVQMDVTNIESINNAYKIISGLFNSINVLINNAGIRLKTDRGLDLIPFEDIVITINTNLIAPIVVTQKFLPLLKEGSRVINISSTLGSITNGMIKFSPVYSISKTGLNAVTCQYHLMLKNKGIAVYSMCPGWVKTELGGVGAERTVEEGARTAVWLATEAPFELSGKFIKDNKVIPW